MSGLAPFSFVFLTAMKHLSLEQERKRVATSLAVSFSGGKTSGYMAKRLRDTYEGPMVFCFMNTGCEDERTLAFVDRCDREWDLRCVWLEAVIHPEHGAGTTHKIVDFKTAARSGEPFEEMIKKYGIPNRNFPQCTRELKSRVMTSYLRSIEWRDCLTALGMRADEPDRIKDDPKLVYPLAQWWPTNKLMINDWWEEQPFQLGLLAHEGNCMWCWKKSLKKLVRIAGEAPERFAFPLRMEAEHGIDRFGKRLTFFREGRSAKDILAIADILQPQSSLFAEHPDEDSGCSESCEVFSNE